MLPTVLELDPASVDYGQWVTFHTNTQIFWFSELGGVQRQASNKDRPD